MTGKLDVEQFRPTVVIALHDDEKDCVVSEKGGMHGETSKHPFYLRCYDT